jgi:hypothetical protein
MTAKSKANLNPTIAQIKRFATAERNAAKRAAILATRESHDIFSKRDDKRPRVPGRPGRNQIHIPTLIHFDVVDKSTTTTAQSYGSIALRQKDLKKNYHYLIQEVGTGQAATIISSSARRSSATRGTGAIRNTTQRTIRSQIGRKIASTLTWRGERPNGQIVFRRKVRVADVDGKHTYVRKMGGRIVIMHEIRGKHYIKKAVEIAFRRYRDDVLFARSRYLHT